MHQAVLLIGGNQGDRERLIERTHTLLSAIGEVACKSSLYETQAWGGASEGNFLNQALILLTPLPPLTLLEATQEIEHQLGRSREVHWGNRTMDIDIIYIDDLIYQDEKLALPHPLMSERNFVLVPLTEILPDFVHPVLHLDHRALLNRCADTNKVERYITKKM